jgi:AmmeMemoRadiSam system protein A
VFIRFNASKLARDEKTQLLKIARQAIEAKINKRPPLDFDLSCFPKLSEKCGAFVTLTKDKDLRGCIGLVKGTRPLYQVVRDMAQAAATQDPRFRPIHKDELATLHIEISVLSTPRRISSPRSIKIRKHGILIKQDTQQGLLLPQVAARNRWNRATLLENACIKAGLPKEAWQNKQVEIYVFNAQVFEE